MESTITTKERPILFSGPMVRAILAGRKTVTRRLWKMPHGCIWHVDGNAKGEATGSICDSDSPWWGSVDEIACPHGSLGDRLWVRETWTPDHSAFYPNYPVIYRADGYDPRELFSTERPGHVYSPEQRAWFPFKWRPSIFMPREHCRIVLEIESVRAERLHEITDDDAVKEGFRSGRDKTGHSPRDQFALLWDTLNGRGAWHANPWVWVIEFKRINNER